MLSDAQIQSLRLRFPILRSKTYLYNCSQGALSDAVEGAMQGYAESWRTSSDPWGEWTLAYEALRVEFARFINASPEEVAIIGSASGGINPIANALSFEGRNKVVMGEYEFPTMGHIWLAQRPRGADVQFLEGMAVEAYAQAIDERTRIVPVTHVSFVNGMRSDVDAITRMAHERGALVFLDGYQDCGTRPMDVRALDVDFFVTGALKYLLGPAGIAFLYVRKSLIESLTPTMTSWFSQRDVFAFDTQRLDLAATARRFENGTPAIPNVFMARAGIELLASVGMQNVAAQVERLTGAFLEGVAELGVESKTPAPSVGPLVVLRSVDAAALVARLSEENVVVSSRRDGVRFAFHVYNTMEDVARVLEVLEKHHHLLVRSHIHTSQATDRYRASAAPDPGSLSRV